MGSRGGGGEEEEEEEEEEELTFSESEDESDRLGLPCGNNCGGDLMDGE